MKTFDFADAVRKETAKKGTGDFPVIFKDQTGKIYQALSISTETTSDHSERQGVTIVTIGELH